VSARGSTQSSRCPVLGRASLLLLAVWLAACSYYPRPVEGLSPTAWLDLPLRRWLADDRAEPLAVAICRLPECGPDMVVSIVELHGRDADAAEAVLKDPERLVRALRMRTDNGGSKEGRTDGLPVAVAARPLRDGLLKGFTLSLSRTDGSRAVFGAALGHRTGSDLRVVLAIGADPDAVEAATRKAALENLSVSSLVSPGIETCRPLSLGAEGLKA
jgi:hypothetical protein